MTAERSLRTTNSSPPALRWIDTVQHILATISAGTAGLAVVAMVLITGAEVLFRYFFNAPLGWNVAFTEQYLMVGVAFLGLTAAYVSGAHVAVESLVARFGPRTQSALTGLGYIVVALGCGIVCVNGADAAISSFNFNETPAAGGSELPINHGWWRLLVPIGAGMLLLCAALDLVRLAAGRRPTPTTQEHLPEEQEL